MDFKSWDSSSSNIYSRYSRHVYLVPTDNWQLATWAATRSTRFAGTSDTDLKDSQSFAELYAIRNYAPMLWYTPGGILSDQIYDFLHRLPTVERIIVLSKKKEDKLTQLDKKNLEAMLGNCWERAQASRSLSKTYNQLDDFCLAQLESKENSALKWLKLDTELKTRIESQSASKLILPRIFIVVPEIPQIACALVPLAAYVQGTLVYMSEQDTQNARDIVDKFISTLLEDSKKTEVWLVGSTRKLEKLLEESVCKLQREQRKFDHTVTVRGIPASDHFTASEQAGVMLLTYRYLDWMLLNALTRDEGREFFFTFLDLPGMRTLHHYCNRVLDISDQLRRKNFRAIGDVHEVYWSLPEQERRNFIYQFQEKYKSEKVISRNLAVIADYSNDDTIPHYLIDAAAFAARRTAPLLLLQPLPPETSYYIGSLMDKIDDQLNNLNNLYIEKIKLKEDKQQNQRTLFEQKEDSVDAQGFDDTAKQIGQQDSLNKKYRDFQKQLHNSIYKTGEVLYESLVPFAMRKALHQLCPQFLTFFIHDPSLPVELIRESHNSTAFQSNRESDDESDVNTKDLARFWGLRYAIGHISSINFYETNLTSNISFFYPRTKIQTEINVLLCSNPTDDLFFSAQEAMKIAELFEGKEVTTISNNQVKLDNIVVGKKALQPKVEHLNSERRGAKLPIRENLLSALRENYDIVHYTGHAFFDNVLPGRSGLLLRDGVLTASDVRFLLDLNQSPIIYANACSAGRIKSVSSRFTGLAAAFIRAGAAGYISPLWSIDDREASSLATEYYNALLKEHHPIGECLRRAKLAHAKKPNSITWASLVLYGDSTLCIIADDEEIS